MKMDLKDVSVKFGKRQILKDLSIGFEDKKITAIVGQSGCGKSTLLKSLNRIVEEDGGVIEGDIHLSGKSIFSISKENLRKSIGLVSQQPISFPYSIERNIRYILKYHYDMNKKEEDMKIEEYLKAVKLYDEVKDNLKMSARKLSGGQQQRLAIARSLCVEPEVLMLDEPCSALDMKNTIYIEQMLVEMKKKYSIIIVTHNLSQAMRIADKIIFMDSGKIIESSEKNDFFNYPKTNLAKDYIKYM